MSAILLTCVLVQVIKMWRRGTHTHEKKTVRFTAATSGGWVVVVDGDGGGGGFLATFVCHRHVSNTLNEAV